MARVAAFALAPLGVLGMGSAAQAAGLTTAFNPAQWLLVNTAITGETTPSNIYQCSIIRAGQDPSACVDEVSGNGFLLYGSSADTSPTPSGDNNTIFSIKNTNWRPYVVTFNWTLPPTSGASSAITLSIDDGVIYTLSSEGNTVTGIPSGDCPGGSYCNPQSATAYVPAGATLTFTVFSDNAGGAPKFTMEGFNAVEVPAPLPITGSSAVLLYSRRLRRRTLTASKQPPALHPTTGKVLSLAEQRSRHQQQRALTHYSALLGGPVAGRP